MDPDQGRPREEIYYSSPDQPEIMPTTQEQEPHTYTDCHNAVVDDGTTGNTIAPVTKSKKEGKKERDDGGKMVDIVLSDMCEPWEQTTGFWKRSLSDPYIRMMNTSGINFKDHAGSMVCCTILKSGPGRDLT